MTYQYKFVKARFGTAAPDPCDISVLGSQGWYLAHILQVEDRIYYIMVLAKE